MACKERSVQLQDFVEEIDYNEIEKLEVVGKGSFGVVWKGKWCETYVAVKQIDSEAEREAFAIEVRQLSRVDHPNIVKLYGACTQNPVCLVMEYAEGGSLYNVLHCKPQPRYSASHAMSWVLQCAQGVAYLHNMKPKALIHRDLKPPNLLLVMEGKVLKICDFGTACDKTTYMTNSKGSAPWMAPEVFEGSNYTEKCDVYSWGIILWEVLSRRKPFDDVGGSAFRILWTVHQGERPPLMNGCPQPIEQLMTRCWDKNPSDRPSMDQVVYVMTHLFSMFSGHDDPIQYSSGDSYSSQGSDTVEEDMLTDIQTSSFGSSQTSIVTSLNGSVIGCEELTQPIHVEVDPDVWSITDPFVGTQNGEEDEIKDRDLVDSLPNSSSTRHEDLDNVYLMLDPQLHPITPDNSCQVSVRVFEQHKQLAQEYLKVQTEIALLSRSMDRLSERLSEAEGLSQLDQQDSERHEEKLRRLEDEKENLLKLHDNLKVQLRIIKSRRGNVGEDGWVFVPQQDHSHLT